MNPSLDLFPSFCSFASHESRRSERAGSIVSISTAGEVVSVTIVPSALMVTTPVNSARFWVDDGEDGDTEREVSMIYS